MHGGAAHHKSFASLLRGHMFGHIGGDSVRAGPNERH